MLGCLWFYKLVSVLFNCIRPGHHCYPLYNRTHGEKLEAENPGQKRQKTYYQYQSFISQLKSVWKLTSQGIKVTCSHENQSVVLNSAARSSMQRVELGLGKGVRNSGPHLSFGWDILKLEPTSSILMHFEQWFTSMNIRIQCRCVLKWYKIYDWQDVLT